MIIDVRPRYVAAPWELDQRTSRRIQVGREAEVVPEAGPLELYCRAFPDRAVRWDPERQLFEVYSTDPVSAFREYVFFWDAPPDPETGEYLSAEEIAELVDRNDARLVKRFMPFDYAFVLRRMREAREYEELGNNRARKHARRIADHNANVTMRLLRAVRQMWDDWAEEDRRWLPVLSALHAGARPDVALTEKIPLKQVGIDLSVSASSIASGA